jgi:predicted phosphohydrolase
MFSKLSFQIISDLHLEKKKYNDEFLHHSIKASNLILAGDIGNPLKSNYKNYLKYCSFHYKRVFLVLGNHEYWGNSINGTEKLINDICTELPNIFIMNNRCIEIEENHKKYKIFGSTMWSFVYKNLYSMDNLIIKDFNFTKRNIKFFETKRFLENNIYDLIITHHSPTFQLIHGKYLGMDNNILFASNIDHLIWKHRYWICGHLHEINPTQYKNLITNCCHDTYHEKIVNLD